jgi:hypothetical protein
VAWNYDPALSTDRDKVRFYAGDTDTSDQQAADETIDAILIAQPNVLLAARAVCLSRAAYFSRFASTANGALSITGAYSRAQGFEDRAKTLLAEATTASSRNARPMVGGVSVAQGERMDADTDAIPPMFRRGQFGFRSNTRRGE